MSTHNPSPVQILLPDSLLPEALLQRLSPQASVRFFQQVPPTLRMLFARGGVSAHHTALGLSPIEALVYEQLSGTSASCLGPDYPAWAMMSADAAEKPTTEPFSRWWASAGSIRIERDGVSFVPVDALGVSVAERREFWAVVWPMLQAQGWSALGQSEPRDAGHVLLQAERAVPMQQASPWSLAHVKLTDCLPMSEECAHWRRLWMNIQVELEQAQFNLQREARGLPKLNCLWFWGGGEHSWAVSVGFPRLKSVSADGVYEASEATPDTPLALSQLLFWQQVLAPQLTPLLESAARPAGPSSTLYVFDFQGWDALGEGAEVLEQEVMLPMRKAGIAFDCVLLGQQGWRTLRSNWLSRLQFWKNAADWSVLGEPEAYEAPTEKDLEDAWQAGQRDQQRIHSDWK